MFKALILLIILLTNLYSIEYLSTYENSKYYTSLESLGNGKIVAAKYNDDTSNYTLEFLDVSNLNNISMLSEYNVTTSVYDLLYHNSYLYIAAYENLEKLDLSNINSPTQIGIKDVYSKAEALAVVNDTTLFVGAGGTYSEIVDISDDTPVNTNQFFGTQDVNNTLYSVKQAIIKDNHLFTIASVNHAIGERVSNDVLSIDISDTNNPTIISSIDSEDFYNSTRIDGHSGMSLVGNKLYVVGGMNSILIFDIGSDGKLTFNKKVYMNMNIGTMIDDGENLIFTVYYGKGLNIGDNKYDPTNGVAIAVYNTITDQITDYIKTSFPWTNKLLLLDDKKTLLLSTNQGIVFYDLGAKTFGGVGVGWNLLGNDGSDINVSQKYTQNNLILWGYKNNDWMLYTTLNIDQSIINSFTPLSIIEPNQGFWLYTPSVIASDKVYGSEVLADVSESNVSYIDANYVKHGFEDFEYTLYKNNNKLYFRKHNLITDKTETQELPNSTGASKVSSTFDSRSDMLHIIFQNASGNLEYLHSIDFGDNWLVDKVINSSKTSIEADIVSADSFIYIGYHAHNDFTLNFARSDFYGLSSRWDDLQSDILGKEGGYQVSISTFEDTYSQGIFMAHGALHDQKEMVITKSYEEYSGNPMSFSNYTIDSSSADGQIFAWPSTASVGNDLYAIYLNNDTNELKIATALYWKSSASDWNVTTITSETNGFGAGSAMYADENILAVVYCTSTGELKLASSTDKGVSWSIKIIGDTNPNSVAQRFVIFKNIFYNKLVVEYINSTNQLYRYVD